MLFDYIRFYHLLEQGLSRNGVELRKWMMDELDLSVDQVQRRLSGTTKPNIDEIILIFTKAPNQALLSFELFKKLEALLVEQTSFSNEAQFKSYFTRLEQVFSYHLTQEDPVLHYAAHDLPLFLFTNDKLLLEYKYAVWTNQIYEGSIPELPPEIHLKARKVHELYRKTPGKETWYYRAIDLQAEQLNALQAQGYIDEIYCGKLKERLRLALKEHAEWTRVGQKADGIQHRVSHAPFFTMGNGAALTSKDSNLMWSALWNAQVISSNTQTMTSMFMKEWNYHRKISTPISTGPPLLLKQWEQRIDELLV